MKKRYILGIVILSLIGLGIYAYAGTLMDSSEVSFDNTDIDTDAETVQEALEELYDKLSETHIIIDLGTAQTFDVKYECQKNGIDYTTLTADNFLISSVGINQSSNVWKTNNGLVYGSSLTVSIGLNYNVSTGVLTFNYSATQNIGNGNYTESKSFDNGTVNAHVYLIS